MAPPKKTAKSPTPGPSTVAPAFTSLGDTIYTWAAENHDPGYVFTQQELLDTGFVPNSDVGLLLPAVEYLVKISRFRVHDRASGSIGWELVDPEVAKNYAGLKRDEKIVLQVIQGAKNSGIWTKTIQTRTGLHQNTVDKIYKALEGKNLIKPMKSVTHPQRKMWILAGLTPSEDATGGSWFSEGVLDQGLISTISEVIEVYVSSQSWQENLSEEEEEDSSNQKRKRSSTDFEEDGNDRVKFAKVVDERNKVKSVKQHGPAKYYTPFDPGHRSYPTVTDITRYLTDINITASPLPSNAIGQLLQVMVYDDRLFKVSRPARTPDEAENIVENTTTMYRSFKTPSHFMEKRSLAKRQPSSDPKVRAAAERAEEIEALGSGGASEVPCMKCPVFDICGDGGPVSAATCVYFAQWYEKIAEADHDKEAGEKKVHTREKVKVDKGKEKIKALPFNGDRGPSIEIEIEELEPS